MFGVIDVAVQHARRTAGNERLEIGIFRIAQHSVEYLGSNDSQLYRSTQPLQVSSNLSEFLHVQVVVLENKHDAIVLDNGFILFIQIGTSWRMVTGRWCGFCGGVCVKKSNYSVLGSNKRCMQQAYSDEEFVWRPVVRPPLIVKAAIRLLSSIVSIRKTIWL